MNAKEFIDSNQLVIGLLMLKRLRQKQREELFGGDYSKPKDTQDELPQLIEALEELFQE